jgi:muramoyltetrapeptide carboxypeptidase
MKHIRILSPASAIDPQWINRARTRLEQWGFVVSVSEHANGNIGRFSAPDALRVADLNAAFADPTVDIILCSRGGYGMQRIIDQVVLPSRPKEQWPLLVGFSDITELHSLLSINGVPSLHANMCKDLSLLPDDDIALNAERDFLMATSIPSPLSFTSHLLPLTYHPSPHHSPSPIPPTPYTIHHTSSSPLNRSGEAKGKLIGGNLSVLYGLQGTPYSLQRVIEQCAEPPILFIEDISENHYHVDRMLHNLRMSGVLDAISGLVVGQFTDCEDDPSMGCTLLESIRQVVEPYSFPVLFDYPSGHIDSNYPLLLSADYHLLVP